MTDCARCMEQCGECCGLTRSATHEAPIEAPRYDLERLPNFFIPTGLPSDVDWDKAEMIEMNLIITEIKVTQEQTDAMLAILRGER